MHVTLIMTQNVKSYLGSVLTSKTLTVTVSFWYCFVAEMVNKSKIWMKTFTNAFVSLYNERRIQIQLRTVSCKMNPAFTARHPLTLYHLANSTPKKKRSNCSVFNFFFYEPVEEVNLFGSVWHGFEASYCDQMAEQL